MLTFLEHTHFSGEKFSSSILPLSHYKQFPGQIDWPNAVRHLPLDFQVKHLPENRRLPCDSEDCSDEEYEGLPQSATFPILYGIRIPDEYSGPLTKQEFDEIMEQEKRCYIFSNKSVQNEWFEPYMPTFTDDEWVSYTQHRALTEQQFDLYGWRGDYNQNAPLSRIPHRRRNFGIIFLHPQLTMEFIQAHLEEALANNYILIQSEVGYRLALEHQIKLGKFDKIFFNRLIKPEDLDVYPEFISEYTFYRDDLPMWFTDKYRESIGNRAFNSRPSKKLVAWLREHRPNLWVSDTPASRINPLRTSFLLREENLYKHRIKETLAHFF